MRCKAVNNPLVNALIDLCAVNSLIRALLNLKCVVKRMDKWHNVNTDDDISNLMESFAHFHDSCITEIRYTSGTGINADNAMIFAEPNDVQADFVFQSQWNPKTLVLRFAGIRKMHIVGWQRYYSCEITGCYLKFHNDLISNLDESLIVWADDGGFYPMSFIEKRILSEPDTSFIIAENLAWREAEGYAEYAR